MPVIANGVQSPSRVLHLQMRFFCHNLYLRIASIASIASGADDDNDDDAMKQLKIIENICFFANQLNRSSDLTFTLPEFGRWIKAIY